MSKKYLAVLFVLFSAVFTFSPATRAQESETASESKLLQIMLPENAQRVLPQSVPAEVSQVFDKVIAAGGGKLRQGETEVLLFAGAGYKKTNAASLVNRFTGAVKNAGWKYKVEGEENGVTLFSAVQESPRRRGIVGFYGATDDALILAAMEVLPNKGSGIGNGEGDGAQNATADSADSAPPVQNKSVRSSAGDGSIVGAWTNGYVSTLVSYTPVYGPPSKTPGRSSSFKYVFHPNGTFEFTGLMQMTQYSCTTSYFQDKRGKYTINGSQITLNLTKNFWRQQDNCAASNNREINHKLDAETYTLSVRRNDRGKDEVCLDSGEGDACYEREAK